MSKLKEMYEKTLSDHEEAARVMARHGFSESRHSIRTELLMETIRTVIELQEAAEKRSGPTEPQPRDSHSEASVRYYSGKLHQDTIVEMMHTMVEILKDTRQVLTGIADVNGQSNPVISRLLTRIHEVLDG